MKRLFRWLVFLAVVFAKLLDRTGRLIVPIFAHALFNLVNVVMFFLHPDLLRWLDRQGP